MEGRRPFRVLRLSSHNDVELVSGFLDVLVFTDRIHRLYDHWYPITHTAFI